MSRFYDKHYAPPNAAAGIGRTPVVRFGESRADASDLVRTAAPGAGIERVTVKVNEELDPLSR